MTPAADMWAVEAASLPLAFAQVREDPRLDMALAESLPAGATVVMIASGGDTAVYLGRLPVRLHLVDVNPAQIALSRLKWRLADQQLDDAAEVLGHLPLPADDRWRKLGGLLDQLGYPDDIFGPEKLVALLGPDHAGRYEVTFAELRKRLEPEREMLERVLCSPTPVMDLDNASLGTAMSAAFMEVMKLENLVCLFGDEATQNPRLPFSEHFATRTIEAFRRMAPRSNPYLWQILAGRFYAGCPYDWLERGGMAVNALRADPQWHIGKMDEVLESFPAESADLVHLSNILDWLSPAAAQAMLAKVARVLKTGGRVIIRQLNSSLEIRAMESDFTWDVELGRQMERRDRSYFYPQIFIGRKA